MNMVCTYCGDPMVCHDNDQPVCCCGELHFVSEEEPMRAREFLTVYRQYRAAHGIRYSFATAWNVAVRGLPF